MDIIGNRAEWQMLANVVLAMLLGGVIGTYVLAIGLTLLVTAVLWLIGRMERRLHRWPDEPADR